MKSDTRSGRCRTPGSEFRTPDTARRLGPGDSGPETGDTEMSPVVAIVVHRRNVRLAILAVGVKLPASHSLIGRRVWVLV